MNDSYFLVALAIYAFWNIFIISERATRYRITKHPIRFSFDVLYFVLMIYFLFQGSINFLVLGTIIVLVHVFFGIYIEFFRPEIATSDIDQYNIMKGYWNFVVVDTFVTLTTFGIVLIGKV